jgi:hypothetical protein
VTLAHQPFVDLWDEEPTGCRACAHEEPCEVIVKLGVEEAQRFESLRRMNTDRNRKRFNGAKRAIREHLGIRR